MNQFEIGFRAPLAWPALTGFLVLRGAPCVERVIQPRYLRTVRIDHCSGWIAIAFDASRSRLCVEVAPDLQPVLEPLRVRLRHLFDLDAEPSVVDTHLAADPLLEPSIRCAAGLRVPGAIDGFELALRAVLGQQISVKAATTVFGRLCEFFGASIDTKLAGLNRLPPTAQALAEAPLQQIVERGLIRRRAQTVQRLARAVADGRLRLEPGADLERTKAMLASLPGIGPWTTAYIAMRALDDPDAFPDSDLALLKATDITRPTQLNARADRWRPWRAYAAMHLWHMASAGG